MHNFDIVVNSFSLWRQSFTPNLLTKNGPSNYFVIAWKKLRNFRSVELLNDRLLKTPRRLTENFKACFQATANLVMNN